MKKFKTQIAVLSVGATLSAAAFAPQIAFAHGKAKPKDQHVTVTVDSSGYHPTLLNLKAGKPVHMTFVSKGDTCANDVSIPSLKKTFSLQPGQKKDIVFTPKKGQTITFSCAMKMFKGKAVAK